MNQLTKSIAEVVDSRIDELKYHSAINERLKNVSKRKLQKNEKVVYS